MSDPFEGFENLEDPAKEEHYPGSKRTKAAEQVRLRGAVIGTPEKPVGKQELPWDANPTRKTVRVKGVPITIELFYIGALARALGRQPVTIRSWITKGYLPRARFRTNPAPGTKGGKQLWTRAEIEAIVRIATEEKFMEEWHPDPKSKDVFAKRVLEFFKSEVIG